MTRLESGVFRKLKKLEKIWLMKNPWEMKLPKEMQQCKGRGQCKKLVESLPYTTAKGHEREF